MRRRSLCGLEVSEIGFGGWVVGSELYRLSDEEARRLVNKALDLGINLFDTADIYGRGGARSSSASGWGDTTW